MGALALAGMVSGMGQGLERGLQQTQSGLIQYGLQDADRQFQSEKLKLQMEHAERLQQASTAAAAGENEKNRSLQVSLADKREAGDTARTDKTLQSHEKTAEMQVTGAKETAKEHSRSAKEIAQLTNDANERIHKATNDVSKYVADVNMRNALTKSYSDAQDALKTEINRLNIIVTDYKQDPNNINYKAAVKELETKHLESKRLAQSLASLQEQTSKVIGVETPPAPQPKKYVIPDTGSPAPAPGPQSMAPESALPPTAPPKTRGLVQIPPPSAAEQEMMRRSLNP
jgi:chromosome segregation ATPase